MTQTSPHTTDPAIQKSLRVCVKEGAMAQVMIIITDYYLIPFGLLLGASPLHIGLLVAIPQLLAAVAQLGAVTVVRLAGSRRTFLVIGAGAQVACLIPIALLACSAFPARIAAFITLVAAFRVMGGLLGPPWGSLVSDYLPENQRGAYFGARSRILGITGIVSIVFWGLVLSGMRKVSEPAGFVSLFLAAAAFRAASAVLLARMADLPVRRTPESDFTLWMFLRRIRESNFLRFTLYVASLTFATSLAAPYFSVLMLRELQFTYMSYMFVHLGTLLAGLISFPIWGRHADVIGNARVIKLTGLLVPVVPFLWLLSQKTAYLMLVEMAAGFIWGGFTLATANFIFDAVVPEKRVRVLAYFNLVNGLAIFAGAALGGMLADVLPPVLGHRLLALFVLSGVLRLAANVTPLTNFKEVRAETKKVSSRDLLYSVVGLRPLIGPNTDFNNLPPRG